MTNRMQNIFFNMFFKPWEISIIFLNNNNLRLNYSDSKNVLKCSVIIYANYKFVVLLYI